MLTEPVQFCGRCQQIMEWCECPVSSHSLFVTDIPQSVNGDSGDSPLSPLDAGLTSTQQPAVTAVTPPSDHHPRHARNGDSSGDISRSLSPDNSPQRQISWSASDLLAASFPEPRWVVPGIIPEGLTLFAGPPKVGKSWAVLGLSIAKAAGGKAFGAVDVEQGAVLYEALEDTPRRLQRRLRQVLAGDQAPEHLTIAVESPVMYAGGLDKICQWIERPRPVPVGLVIIDVFERLRGPVPPGISAYAADYQAISAFKKVADTYGIGLVLIHHVRKVTADDFLSEISGTLGLSGAADTICALKRSRGELDGVLHVTGRDVDEQEYALKFAPDLGAWQLVGLASEYGLSETRRKILAYLRLHEGSKPAEIAIGTGLSRDLVKQTCSRMSDDDQLDTDGHGRYFVPAAKEPQ